MCNIVNSPCKVCNEPLPLHLGDFLTNPEEVECFCENHLPDHDVRIYTLVEDSVFEEWDKNGEVIYRALEHPCGWKMGIRALTGNAEIHRGVNFPNTYANWEYVDL